ncbi:MAG: hypothetical protein FWD66_06490 [Paludibacter sp.]|nr:hypothetical protein [Paludibacter sp.]
MKFFIKSFFIIITILIFSTLQIFAQTDENGVGSVRSPETEALRQTERMKTDLNLTPTQEKLVYNINLKYEKQRQQSNDRRKAVERIKNKNDELQKVLTEHQYAKLQSKRYNQSALHRQSNASEPSP